MQTLYWWCCYYPYNYKWHSENFRWLPVSLH